MLGKSILVVDANESSRKFLIATLHEKQFKIFEASSGKEALIFAWRDNPDLVLFDPVLADLPPQEFIRRLRKDARTSHRPLVALSSDANPALAQACHEAGVTEYIVKSAQAMPALESMLARVFGAEPPAESEAQPAEPVAVTAEKAAGQLIVFLSAKGGTGTSSLCANLATSIKVHQPEASIVVADLVLPIGSIAQIVGYSGKLNLSTISELTTPQSNGEYFRKSLPEPERWQFQLLAGSPDPQHGNNIRVDRIGQIVDVLRATYDYVVLDLGRSLSRISLPLIQQADLITLIVSTDQSTIHLTKTVWEYLQSQGIEDRRIFAILNRAVGLEGLTKSEAETIIGIPIKLTMPYLAGNFALANNLNQPITVKYPRDTATFVLKDAAENMVKLTQQLRKQRSA